MEVCPEVYECVSCSQPAFSGFGSKTEAGQFGEEEFLAFASCFRMVISSECDSFNGHTRCLLSCRCKAKLGYFLPHYALLFAPKSFIARVGRVRGRGKAKLTEYVETQARYAQHEFLKEWDRSVIIDTAVKVYSHAYMISEDHALDESDGFGGEDEPSVWSRLAEHFVLEEILPRLPLESLRRFRRVSKKWWHYISNDSRVIFSAANKRMSVIVTREFPRHRFLFVDSKKVEVMDVAVFEKRWVGKYTNFHVVGSCNGLICLWLQHPLKLRVTEMTPLPNYEAVVLWNPETGEARDTEMTPLPKSFYLRDGQSMPKIGNGCVHGFAFDRARNDYKVVRVWIERDRSRLKFEIFSRNTGVWREVENGFEGYEFFRESANPVSVGSRLFWALLRESDERQCVLWFDVSTDEFGIMEHDSLTHLSNLPDNQQNTRHRLVNSKEHDSLACLSLPEEASKDFLFQLFRSLANEKPAALPRDEEPQPWKFCGVSWNRYFFEENKSNLVAYDCETGVAQQLFYTKNCNLGEAHDYVPSLVSVYPDIATMMQGNRNMKGKYWVHVFALTLGFTEDFVTGQVYLPPENRFEQAHKE